MRRGLAAWAPWQRRHGVALVTWALVSAGACAGPAEPADGGPTTEGGRDAAPPDAERDAHTDGPLDGGAPDMLRWSPQPWEDCEGDGREMTAGPDDYRSVLDELLPGDVLKLQPGTYARGMRISISGEPGRCVVIEALDPDNPPVVQHGGSNTIDLVGASWIKLRHLVIDSRGDAGYFGVALKGEGGPSHHVVLEGCRFVGQGGSQQTVGISTKAPAIDWVIRGNVIEGAGTGLYLGNSNGREPFIRGVVEFNAIIDTVGYNMEIKHQVTGSRDDVPAEVLPDGPAQTVVRHNVFAKRRAEVGESGARPNVLFGHFPPDGSGAEDEYVVYGNLFYDNPTERLLQAEGNLRIYHNLFVNPRGDAVSLQAHNDKPRKVDVLFNTVVAQGLGIGLSGAAAGFDQRVRYNAVFASTPLQVRSGVEEGNTVASESEATTYLADPTGAPGDGLDLHPLPGQLTATIDLASLPDLLESRFDFDARPRTGMYVGAYAGPASTGSGPLSLAPPARR